METPCLENEKYIATLMLHFRDRIDNCEILKTHLVM